jgi:hypothetical protein
MLSPSVLADGPEPSGDGSPIEPNAGQWRTWVISSGKDYRVPPPPGAAATQAELRALEDLISQNDAAIQQQITFWDAGAPAYRWIDLITSRLLAATPTTAYPTAYTCTSPRPCTMQSDGSQ